MSATPRTTSHGSSSSSGATSTTISPPSAITPSPEDDFPYGRRAVRLLEELKRSDWLSKYDEDGVRAVLDEMHSLQRMQSKMEQERIGEWGNANVAVTLQVLHVSILRNKRCLLAYVKYRQDVLQARWWSGLGTKLEPDEIARLAPAEVEYYAAFQDIMADVMDEDAMGIDLCAYSAPGRDLDVQVEALKDAGTILLQSGAIVRFTKGSTYALRRTDVEALIKQRVLRLI